MNRVQILSRFALLGLIIAVLFIAKRLLLDRYSGTEPIRIDDEPAAATFENAFPKLTIERPIFLTFPPDGTHRIAALRYDERSGETTSVQPIHGEPGRATMPVFSFGEDESGELYFVTSAGIVNRIMSHAK